MAISGCTTQAWYEGAKQGAENNCRSQPPGESERCLEKLNKKTYEQYEKERSEKGNFGCLSKPNPSIKRDPLKRTPYVKR